MRPHRKTIPIPGTDLVVQVTDDLSSTLILGDSSVAYHSASGAAAETRHVYLQNSGVAERLESGQSTSVLEIGLGTALGMLMTLDAAIQSDARLHYEAVEFRVLSPEVLKALDLRRHLVHTELADSFIDWRTGLGESISPGRHCWRPDDRREVWILAEDARKIDFGVSPRFDAIYFDPFAPAVNPELWSAEFLCRVGRTLSTEGRLATYCVNRKVRDAFQDAGFRVQRVPGPPGGKREVLIATPDETVNV